MKRSLAHSVCPHDCASACTLDIEISKNNRVGRIYGSHQNPYTAGVICSKVARYENRVYHRDRLTKPLRRKTSKSPTASLSDFEVIEWEDALDITANSFKAAVRNTGQRLFGFTITPAQWVFCNAMAYNGYDLQWDFPNKKILFAPG